MGEFLEKILGKKQSIRLQRIIKGSLKDPFLFLGVGSALLIYLIPFGLNFVSDLPLKGSFSLAAVSNILQNQENTLLAQTDKSLPDSPELLLVENSSVKPATPPTTFNPRILGALVDGASLEDTKKIITEHTVEQGETIASIAENYNVSVETIVWANDLKTLVVKPGQALFILPVSGIMHSVREGETVATIAQKYNADINKAIAFNDLANENDIFTGEVIIIPGGRMPFISVAKPVIAPNESSLSTNNFNGLSHIFPFGQCTWWVAQKRAIPFSGNANEWLNNAAAEGLAICKGSSCLPKKGAVISLQGSRTYGHVGFVEDVKDDKVIFSEMNYIGWGKVNYRTLRIGSPAIIGYIY